MRSDHSRTMEDRERYAKGEDIIEELESVDALSEVLNGEFVIGGL